MTNELPPSRLRRRTLPLLPLLLIGAFGLLPARGLVHAASMHAPSRIAPAISVQQADGDVQDEEVNDTGPRNIVQVYNQRDGHLQVRGQIQLAHAHGKNVSPENMAEAYSSCIGCSTFAVALQIVLVEGDATVSSPQNAAVAVNYQCSHCTTVADAYQYIIPVADPDQVPDNVNELINSMDRELRAIAHDRSQSAASAETRVNALIGQFTDLAANLYSLRDADTHDDRPENATTPTAAAAGTATPTVSPAAASTASPTPTPTPTPTPAPTSTPAAAAIGMSVRPTAV